MSAPYNGMLDDPTLTPEYKHWMACTINGVAAQAARGPVPWGRRQGDYGWIKSYRSINGITEILTNHGWVKV